MSEVLEFHVRVKPGLHLERAAVTQLWREREERKIKREKVKKIKRKIKREREKRNI